MYNETEFHEEIDQNSLDLGSAVMPIIKSEVDKQVEKFKTDYEWYKEQYKKYNSDYSQLRNEFNKLKKQVAQVNEFETFRSIVNENNIAALLSHLNLKTTDINFDGMDSEHIPTWFFLICKYYPDRERVFSIMDLFSVKYPLWAKNFKLPFDYNEQELDLIFSKLNKMYVCNGCIFDGNMGFFYREIAPNQGDLIKLFANSSYVEIPWNLFLKNDLLTTEKYITKILRSLEKKESHSHYFFALPEYQDIPNELASKMYNYIPVNGELYDVHKKFINKCRDVIKNVPELANKFKHKINDNQYSSFYFLNYPLDMQIEYIKQYGGKSYNTKFDLIKKMNISTEDKIKLLTEVAAELLVEK